MQLVKLIIAWKLDHIELNSFDNYIQLHILVYGYELQFLVGYRLQMQTDLRGFILGTLLQITQPPAHGRNGEICGYVKVVSIDVPLYTLIHYFTHPHPHPHTYTHIHTHIHTYA